MNESKPSCYEFDRVVQLSEAVAAGPVFGAGSAARLTILVADKKTAMPAGIEVARAGANSITQP